MYETIDASSEELEEEISTVNTGLVTGGDAVSAVPRSETAVRGVSGLFKRSFFSGDPDVIDSMLKAYGTEILVYGLVIDPDVARDHEIFGRD